MTREDIIRMAEQCGFSRTHSGDVNLWLANPNDLERFAKLVAEHERNACIEAANNALTNEWEGVVDAVEAIRARGQA